MNVELTTPAVSSRTLNSCPICKGESSLVYGNMRDDRYGYPATFPINRCRRCRHTFIPACFDPEQLRNLYTDYYPRGKFAVDDLTVPDSARGIRSWFQGERSSAFHWVPPRVRVLDIGCGFGQTLIYHQRRGCEAWGVEADENIRRVAEKFDLNVHVGLFDANQFEPESFDYVTLDQVIEHVANPHEIMTGIAKVLKRGGTAIVGTPNSSGWGALLFQRKWINWHVPYHLQHYSKRSMAIVARNAGLEIFRTKTITNSEWLFYQWLHLVTYPPIGTPSSFWDPARSKLSNPRRTFRLLGAIHRLKLNHLLTRFADGCGVGDNRLFFLRKSVAT